MAPCSFWIFGVISNMILVENRSELDIPAECVMEFDCGTHVAAMPASYSQRVLCVYNFVTSPKSKNSFWICLVCILLEAIDIVPDSPSVSVLPFSLEQRAVYCYYPASPCLPALFPGISHCEFHFRKQYASWMLKIIINRLKQYAS
jgi:hypothetical protein